MEFRQSRCATNFSCILTTSKHAVFFDFYYLNERSSKDTSSKRKSIGRERADSLPHSGIGAALRYFKGSISFDYLMWKMSWTNYMLLMASIQGADDNEKEVIEVKDSDDIF